MPKFVTFASWSPASWARMIDHPDDRIEAAKEFADIVQATLETFYWLPLATHDVIITFDAPDTITASAVNMAIASTGAVNHIETYELLTQDQLRTALTIAADAKKIYRAPGLHE